MTEKPEYTDWVEEIRRTLKGRTPESLRHTNQAGIELEALYTDAPEHIHAVASAMPTIFFAPFDPAKMHIDDAQISLSRGIRGFYVTGAEPEAHQGALNALKAQKAEVISHHNDGLSQALITAVTTHSNPLKDQSMPSVDPQANAYALHNVGANDITELGYGLAYVSACIRTTGRMPERILIGLGTDIFLNIAKTRALRYVLDGIADVADLKSTTRIHTLASERALRTEDPWTNVLRACSAAAGAMIGEADELTVFPHDWQSDSVSQVGIRIAANLPVILALEGWLDGHPEDAARGSGYIEHLTHTLAKQVWEFAQAVDVAGGLETHHGFDFLCAKLLEDRAVSGAKEGQND